MKQGLCDWRAPHPASECLICRLCELYLPLIAGEPVNDDFLSLSDESEDESDAAILEANKRRAEEAEQRVKQREEDRRRRRESRTRRSGGTISELVEAPQEEELFIVDHLVT